MSKLCGLRAALVKLTLSKFLQPAPCDIFLTFKSAANLLMYIFGTCLNRAS